MNLRSTNESIFKKLIATEKAQQRLIMRKKDETKYKKKIRNEKQQQRAEKVKSVEKRRKIFLDSIKNGRIYECISCHRKCFQTGVHALPPNFEDTFDKLPIIYRQAIGNIATRKVNG